MTRWLLTGAVAAAAWSGSVYGQAPRPAVPATPAAPAVTDGQPGGPIITLKSPGQPERRVQVLRSTRGPDGKVTSEVKDLATGEVYTMVDVNPGGDLDTPTAVLPPSPDALPRAKDRTFDPLLGGGPAAAMPTTETKPGFFRRLLGKPQASPAGPLPSGSRTTPTTTSAPAPAPAPTPTPVLMPVTPPTHSSAPPPAPIQPTIALSARPLRPSEQMREDIDEYLENLKSHPRPSLRMEAASGLADGRYAARAEVKKALVAAAKGDPAAIVRSHCIACLSKLGYADPEYVRELHQWAADANPLVAQAATNALAKLAPKP
jgi:hypothetical protein